jgi:hypothetical protein
MVLLAPAVLTIAALLALREGRHGHRHRRAPQA